MVRSWRRVDDDAAAATRATATDSTVRLPVPTIGLVLNTTEFCRLLKRNADGTGWTRTETMADADGVLFLCPACLRTTHHAVICWFAGRVPDTETPGPGRWTARGSSLADLSLEPSVWLNGPDSCGWHGFVRNGVAA